MAVDVRQRDDVVILKPKGKIIGRSVRDLSKAINDESAKISDSPKFLFDFADVSMMDSSGLGTLLGAHVSIVQKGGSDCCHQRQREKCQESHYQKPINLYI